MEVSWSFTMLLVVTTVALVTFSQTLFQLTIPEAIEKQTETDLETAASQAAAALPPQNEPLTSKLKLQAKDEVAGSTTSRSSTAATWSWNLLRGTSRRRPPSWTWKLIDRQEQLSSLVKVSRRSLSASFQSDRMVPTGPNPLHNSNRSEVIFP